MRRYTYVLILLCLLLTLVALGRTRADGPSRFVVFEEFMRST